MNKFPIYLMVFFLFFLSNCTKKTWQPLFNGATLDGWHAYGGGPVGKAWKVDRGMLMLDAEVMEDWKTKDGGDIVTDKEYENFHLELEWKISKGGNSGIMFYVQDDKTKFANSYETGPEMQVLDNAGHADGKIYKHRAGDLYDLIPCSIETAKAWGEWNKAEIISDKGKLTFVLNGTKVVETILWDEAWRDMLASSKFSQWPAFGTFKKGRICLQDHGNNVWYRNIRIKEL